MKNLPALFIGILLLGSMALLSSCNTEKATHGILVISVVDSTGTPIPYEQVYVATSYQNLQVGDYVRSGWTDGNGEILFMDLLPATYWYDTQDWEDFGACQVYAGIDHYVILWVNTPQP